VFEESGTEEKGIQNPRTYKVAPINLWLISIWSRRSHRERKKCSLGISFLFFLSFSSKPNWCHGIHLRRFYRIHTFVQERNDSWIPKSLFHTINCWTIPPYRLCLKIVFMLVTWWKYPFLAVHGRPLNISHIICRSATLSSFNTSGKKVRLSPVKLKGHPLNLANRILRFARDESPFLLCWSWALQGVVIFAAW